MQLSFTLRVALMHSLQLLSFQIPKFHCLPPVQAGIKVTTVAAVILLFFGVTLPPSGNAAFFRWWGFGVLSILEGPTPYIFWSPTLVLA